MGQQVPLPPARRSGEQCKLSQSASPMDFFNILGPQKSRQNGRSDNVLIWYSITSVLNEVTGNKLNTMDSLLADIEMCWLCSGIAPSSSVIQESSAKLTNQRVSYAFTSSPFSFHARHILPASKFQHSYSCILLIFYRHQWTACVRTVSVNL